MKYLLFSFCLFVSLCAPQLHAQSNPDANKLVNQLDQEIDRLRDELTRLEADRNGDVGMAETFSSADDAAEGSLINNPSAVADEGSLSSMQELNHTTDSSPHVTHPHVDVVPKPISESHQHANATVPPTRQQGACSSTECSVTNPMAQNPASHNPAPQNQTPQSHPFPMLTQTYDSMPVQQPPVVNGFFPPVLAPIYSGVPTQPLYVKRGCCLFGRR